MRPQSKFFNFHAVFGKYFAKLAHPSRKLALSLGNPGPATGNVVYQPAGPAFAE